MTHRLLTLCLVLAALAAAARPAHADHDAVQFGTNINVAADSEIHDAVCFFCSVNVEGKVTGDIVVFFGNVHLKGDAQHDVVDFFGQVRAEDNASIEQDLVSFFGSVRLGENVTVGKDLVALFGTVRAPETTSVGNDRVVRSAWLFFGPVGLLILIVFLIVREYRDYHRRLIERGYRFPPQR